MEILIISILTFIVGYFIGHSLGHIAGYQKCTHESWKSLDTYFEKVEEKRNGISQDK
jgi:hypothetical protein